METKQPRHPWQARISVGLTMLVLAFIGMINTDIDKGGGWDYWKWIVPVYALLALWLSWYVKREKQTISPITIGHELLHWLGVIGAIFLISYLVNLGTLSRFNAGIVHIIILSLGVFLAGIYIEPIFLLIGLLLGFVGVLSAFLAQYMYTIIIPVFIGGALILVLSVWISHKRFQPEEKDSK